MTGQTKRVERDPCQRCGNTTMRLVTGFDYLKCVDCGTVGS